MAMWPRSVLFITTLQVTVTRSSWITNLGMLTWHDTRTRGWLHDVATWQHLLKRWGDRVRDLWYMATDVIRWCSMHRFMLSCSSMLTWYDCHVLMMWHTNVIGMSRFDDVATGLVLVMWKSVWLSTEQFQMTWLYMFWPMWIDQVTWIYVTDLSPLYLTNANRPS